MRTVLVLAIAAILPAGAHDEEQTFAEALQMIVRTSRENFRPVQGARIELHPDNLSYYQPRVNLPGAAECRIDEQPRWSYSCKWRGARCEKLLADTVAALGSEWTRTGSTFKHSGRFRFTQIEVTSACTLKLSVLRQYTSTP